MLEHEAYQGQVQVVDQGGVARWGMVAVSLKVNHLKVLCAYSIWTQRHFLNLEIHPIGEFVPEALLDKVLDLNQAKTLHKDHNMKTLENSIHIRITIEHSAGWFQALSCLACVVVGLMLTFTSTPSSAKGSPPVRDCCGDENYVYRPSTERIRIANSAEVTKQITSLQKNADASTRLDKAIKVGNLVLQARVNGDLFRIGYEQDPPEIREGWQKHYAPYISVDAPELLRILEAPLSERRVSKNLAPGGMACPFARLEKVETLPNKTLLTYQFVHIARSAGMFKGIGIVDYPLELADKGKIGTYRIALNREFKYVPNDPDTDWWTAYTTKAFKDQLHFRLGSNVYPEKKPKLRELLSEITDAEKVCQQKKLFDQ